MNIVGIRLVEWTATTKKRETIFSISFMTWTNRLHLFKTNVIFPVELYKGVGLIDVHQPKSLEGLQGQVQVSPATLEHGSLTSC